MTQKTCSHAVSTLINRSRRVPTSGSVNGSEFFFFFFFFITFYLSWLGLGSLQFSWPSQLLSTDFTEFHVGLYIEKQCFANKKLEKYIHQIGNI